MPSRIPPTSAISWTRPPARGVWLWLVCLVSLVPLATATANEWSPVEPRGAVATVQGARGRVWTIDRDGITRWDGLAARRISRHSIGVAAPITDAVADPDGGLWIAAETLIWIDPWRGRSTLTGRAADRIVVAGSTLWAVGDGRVVALDLRTRRVRATRSLGVRSGESGGLEVGVDREGRLVLGTPSGIVVATLRGTEIRLERHALAGTVRGVTARSAGGAWLATDSHLWLLPAAGPVRRIASIIGGVPSGGVIERSGDAVWVGLRNGRIARVSVRLGRTESLESPALGATRPVTSLMEDSFGGVWASIDDGRQYYRRRDPAEIGELRPRGSGGPVAVNDVVHLDDALWVATEGSGVHRVPVGGGWTGDSAVTREMTGGTGGSVRAIAADGSRLWFGTWGEGLFRLDATTLAVESVGGSDAHVTDIDVARDGAVWVASAERGVEVFSAGGRRLGAITSGGSPGLVNERVTSLLFTGSRAFAAGAGGLDEIRRAPNAGARLTGRAMETVGTEIFDLHARGSNLWLVSDAGLELLPIGGRVSHLVVSRSDLGTDIDRLFAHSSRDALWLGAADRLMLYDLRADSIVAEIDTRGVGDGVPLRGGGTRDAAGNLYLPSALGLAVVPPQAPRPRLYRPPVRAWCERGCASAGGGVRANADAATFGFAAIDYDWPTRNRLQYRLGSVDDGWVDAEPGQRLAVYRGLPARATSFDVRVVDRRGQVVATTVGGAGAGATLTITDVRGSSSWGWLLPVLILGSLVLFVSWAWGRSRRPSSGVEQAVRSRTRALERSCSEAEAASHAKSRFMAMVSHDLRTQLNSVLGYADLIRMRPDSPRSGEWADLIMISGSHLQATVEDLLGAAAVESGELSISVAPVDVVELLEDVRAIAERGNPERGDDLALSVEADRRLRARYLVDPRRLRQVMLNLTSNAIRYSRGPSVRLRAQLLGESPDGLHTLRFSVTDDGPGPRPDEIERIFEPFVRGEGAPSGGIGLGLAICQQVVSALGGKIEIDLDSDTMCRLRFDLDLAPLGPLAPLGSGEAQLNRRVLAVDDEEAVQAFLFEALRELGFEPHVVGSGREALEAVAEVRPALVLTDYSMPEMSGAELAERIAVEFPEESLPVVAVTALPDRAGADFEFDLIVGKPLSIERLKRALREFWPDDPRLAPVPEGVA